jgi:glycosyltransferase involved in cell wall biosynthesis
MNLADAVAAVGDVVSAHGVVPSTTHLVLIPSYNPGDKVFETVHAALAVWSPVWVVVDGSTDGTGEALERLAEQQPALRVLKLSQNQGKGSAVLHGMVAARAAGFTHALTMDSDGQHPATLIPAFMQASQRDARALVLGRPVFDASAPMLRVRGRRVSNFWANLETGFAGIGDSLYGFRVYPIADAVSVMQSSRWMRRFDFDPELSVRLVWRGLRPLNLDAPVKYLSESEGGVSHFQYGRDNVLLTGIHLRLFAEAVVRAPALLWRRLTGQAPFTSRRTSDGVQPHR